jgi:predicted nucleotidyltransferase component of viral defense system
MGGIIVRLSIERLLDVATLTGFRSDVLEKSIRLLNLLNLLVAHPFLKDRIALEGGTALNLFFLDLPRLSIDIDLNYIGSSDRAVMLEEHPVIERAIEAVCNRDDLLVQRIPTEHAGGKWRLQYESALGGLGNLEVDLNYMFRVPLWPIKIHDSKKLGPFKAEGIPILDIHELLVGKLAALFSRDASRDLFDVHLLLTKYTWERERLRLGFVLYGAMNRKDWRLISRNDIRFAERELERTLIPVLTSGMLHNIQHTSVWASQLVDECRQAMGIVLPLSESELELLNRILENGEIDAELITNEEIMIEKITTHPLLNWKVLNVKRHLGE